MSTHSAMMAKDVPAKYRERYEGHKADDIPMKHYIKITLDELREFVTLPMERWESLIEIDRQAERNREKRREALMGRVVGLDD